MKLTNKLIESLEDTSEVDILDNTLSTLEDLQYDIEYKLDTNDLEDADIEQLNNLYQSLEDVINLVKDMLPPDNSDSWKIPKDKVDPYWQKYID